MGSQCLLVVRDSSKMQGWLWILLFVMVWTQTRASPTMTVGPAEEEDFQSKCYDTVKKCNPISCYQKCRGINFVGGWCKEDRKRDVCKRKEDGRFLCQCYAVKGFESEVNG